MCELLWKGLECSRGAFTCKSPDTPALNVLTEECEKHQQRELVGWDPFQYFNRLQQGQDDFNAKQYICISVLSLDPSLLFMRQCISFCIDFLFWLLREIFARLTFCTSSVITQTYYNKLVWKNYWDGKETKRKRLNQSQLTSTEGNIIACWKEQTLAMVGLAQKVWNTDEKKQAKLKKSPHHVPELFIFLFKETWSYPLSCVFSSSFLMMILETYTVFLIVAHCKKKSVFCVERSSKCVFFVTIKSLYLWRYYIVRHKEVIISIFQ